MMRPATTPATPAATPKTNRVGEKEVSTALLMNGMSRKLVPLNAMLTAPVAIPRRETNQREGVFIATS